MPGQVEIYQAAMNEAANAAWDHDWQTAIEAYQSAINEFPEDTNALAGFGLALAESDRFEEALDVYNHIIQLAPNDPLGLEKSAEVLEYMGRSEEAGQKYIAVADVYVSLRDVERAILNWERAVSMLPDEITIRSRLAVAYERTDQIDLAVQEYMGIAGVFQRASDLTKANQALQRALTIDPTNNQIRDSMDALRGGVAIDVPGAAVRPTTRQGGFEPFTEAAGASAAQANDPLVEATELAMGLLAELLFDSDLSENSVAFMAQAIEAQRAGDPTQAADSYAQAIKKGLSHPAAYFNNGLTHIQAGDVKRGANALKNVMGEPTYALAANLALGQGYLETREFDKAIYYLVEAVHQTELAMSPGSDVEGSYSAIHEQLKKESDERLLEMSDALVRFIGSRDWHIQLGEMRNMVDSGQADSMINLLTEPGAGKVSESLERIDNYIERGLYSLAMDEAFFAIEFGPGHVPLHERMADILTLDRKPSSAAEKYNMIANTLMMRGDISKAADIFTKVLQLSPMDVAARRRLIEMLLDQKRTLDGLQQYKELAEIYLTMADTESARKTYQEAVELAQRDSVEPELIAELLYEIGDLDSQRLDWQQALRSYEQIKSLLPGDEKASMAIVDLYFRLGQETEAIQQLDQYLSYCFSNGLSERVVIVLEEQVRNRADEIPLRQRLAKVYQQQNRMSDAIAQMDALGELLLEADRREDAVATIKQIISFDPPDVEGYRQLLQQLEG